ncbi:MFS-type transporter SLC18B1-like [Daphnia pulex]|uniref:MFS-type transporter SLC18B1-like n=1 Tax=Daphnia pulex TaxID=6669 RepID=UPI001EDD50E4|nr:MFS-type transporter SLC18B1-like [Daphnia pulex]
MVRTSSPHRVFATMSDSIVVSPVGSIDGTDTTDHAFLDYRPSAKLITQAARCMSVSVLNDKRLEHSDEEVIQLRNKFLILTKNRAIFKQLERNQKWTLAIICIVYFVCFCTISMLSTFFYEIAILHNISTSTYGLIFSIHPAVVFCTSPIFGHITPSIGPKFMFTTGVFLCGSCNLLFGTLEHVQDDTQFTILCFVVRGLGAVGASAFSTAGATYVANLFPDKISVIMGILETFIGLGFSIGPLLGGSLFTLGGLQLPFYIMGSVMLLILPFSIFCLPETNHVYSKGNLGTKVLAIIFKIPAVFIICVVVAVSSSAWSVLEPTLVIHMEQFKLGPMQLGLLFLITSVSSAISSPFWGWLVSKYNHGTLMMIIGLSVTAVGLLLLGPSPILPHMPNVLWLNIVSLVLIGTFVALAYVPTYQALLEHAVQVGCETEMSTYSIIAGLWASMYSLGEVLGPCIGSILVDVYSFPLAITAIGLLNFAVALILLFYVAFSASRTKNNPPLSKSPLLISEDDASSNSNITQVGKTASITIGINGERERLIQDAESTQAYGTTC